MFVAFVGCGDAGHGTDTAVSASAGRCFDVLFRGHDWITASRECHEAGGCPSTSRDVSSGWKQF